MVSKKLVASLLFVYVVSMLAEQAEGFVPFFTQSDFQKMQLQEKERNKGGQKKSLTSLQQLEEEGFSEQSSADVSKVKTIQGTLGPVRATAPAVSLAALCQQKEPLPLQLAVPVKAGMWLTPRQLEEYQDVLEKLLAEMLQDTPDAA